MRKQMANRLGAAHVRDTVQQFVAGEIDRHQAMESLQIGKSQLCKLRTSYLAAKAEGKGDEWVPGSSGGNHMPQWSEESQEFFRKVLRPDGDAKRYSYAFAASEGLPGETPFEDVNEGRRVCPSPDSVPRRIRPNRRHPFFVDADVIRIRRGNYAIISEDDTRQGQHLAAAAARRDETPRVAMAKELGPYKSIRERKDSLYALLVSAGYLKVASELVRGTCRVAIPNHEIAQVFVNDIQSKINRSLSTGTSDIVCALIDRDMPALKSAIASFLLESVSYFDAAAEGFFHGLTLGFLAVLRKRFRVLSNVESGEGRFDIALKPLVAGFPAFVIEVKAADGPGDDLKALAQDARRQIDGKKYDTTFRAEGIADIVKIGLAYHKDKVELCDGEPLGDSGE